MARRTPSRQLDIYDIFAGTLNAARRHAKQLRHWGLPLPGRSTILDVSEGWPSRVIPGETEFADCERMVGVAVIEKVTGGYFSFADTDTETLAEDAVRAVIQPATVTGLPGDIDIIDFVAWHPDAPGAWRLWNGRAQWLGHLSLPITTDPIDAAALVLVSTPWAWLQDEPGASVCLLDLTKRTIGELRGFERIVCDNTDLALHIDRVLRDVFVPDIVVRQGAGKSALA
jgi:hypothetical protein